MSILTVNGPVEVKESFWYLNGEFLLHDHTEEGDSIGVGNITFKELQHLREHPRSRADNMRYSLSDMVMLKSDIEEIDDVENCVLVDLSPNHTSKDLAALQTLSTQTGVHIVVSAGGCLQKLLSVKTVFEPTFNFDVENFGCISCGLASIENINWEHQQSYLKLCLEASTTHSRGIVPINIILPCQSELLFKNCLETLSEWKRSLDSFPTIIFHGISLPIFFNTPTPDFCLISCDYFAWGGLLLSGNRHPFGYETTSLNEMKTIIFNNLDKVVFGTLHCMKMCGTSWGGPGRSAMLRSLKMNGISLPKSLVYGFLAWYSPPPLKEVEIVYWKCDNCKKSFEEVTPDDSFRKYTFRYCSTKCMREHVPTQADPEKDRQQQKKRPMGSGLGSWGVAVPR